MVLTQTAINRISNQQGRLAIAQKLPCSETWARKLIAANKNNGPLTTYEIVQVIKEKTGLKDNEILEEAAVLSSH